MERGICTTAESILWPTLSFSVHVTTVGPFTADKTVVNPCSSKPKHYDHLYSPSCSSTSISCKAQKFQRFGHEWGLYCIFAMRMRKTALFLFAVWNLTSSSCSSTQMSHKLRKFQRCANV